jgi:tetratricopeptide (TPR) repeat protein
MKQIELAIGFLQNGKFADAELVLQNELAKNADNPEALSTLGILKIYCADYEEAAALLSRASTKKAFNPVTQLYLSLSLAKLNRIEEAEEIFLEVKALAPDNPKLPRIEGAILLGKKNFDEALTILTTYAQENPDEQWDLWNDIGMLYFIFEQFQLGKEAFEKSIELSNAIGLTIPFVHYNLALCLNSLCEIPEAKEQLSIALQQDAELAPAWAVLGLLEAGDGDYDRAKSYIEKAIDLQPEEPTNWFAMAQIMEMSGDNEGAAHYYEEGSIALRRISPNDDISPVG